MNDFSAGYEAANRALERLTASNADFLEVAGGAIDSVAHALPYFTVDDVWEAIEPYGGGIRYTDGRVMGAAMRAARQRGVIRSTGIYRPSRNPFCHATPRRVWERG
jgi:hypothetical protein